MDSILSWIHANQQIIYIVILMIFVGIEVIGRVPRVWHWRYHCNGQSGKR